MNQIREKPCKNVFSNLISKDINANMKFIISLQFFRNAFRWTLQKNT
ncbi:MAG: hypothetical protein RL213_309 [Bacteroidota bacterium]|jgi:hypothetical protein